MKQTIIWFSIFYFGITILTYANEQITFSNNPLDSLLRTHQELDDDTTKVNLLNKISWYYIPTNSDSGVKFGLSALNLAIKIEWTKGQAEAYNNIGEANRFRGNLVSSIENHQKALILYDETEDSSGRAHTLNLLGISYFNLSDLPKAHEFFFEALSLYKEINDQNGIAKTLGYLGILQGSFKEYQLALKYFNESREIYEELNDQANLAVQIGNIGLINFELKNYDAALRDFETALKIFIEIDDLWNQSAFLGNSGLVYSDIGEYAKAESLFVRALEFTLQINDELGVAHQYGNLGNLYLKQAKNSEGKISITKSDLLGKSIQYLKVAETKFSELGEKDQHKKILFSLSEAYKLDNDFKKALTSYTLATEIQDSIFSIENKKMIAELETRMGLDVKEKEIQLLNKDKENQLITTITLISFIGLLGVAAIIILVLYLKLKRDNKMLSENIQKRKEVEESLRLNEIELKKYHEKLEQLVKERTDKLEKEIIEKHEIKNVLNKSEERYNLAVEAAELGTWDWELEDNQVIYSGKYSEMLGYEPYEIKPQLHAWEELVHPEDKGYVFQQLKDHLEGKTELYKTEYRIKTKSGEWKWILDVGKVVEWDQSGKPQRAAGVHHDINDRKRAEIDLEQAKLFAEKANQLKSEFLAQISHEIRSPLNAVLNFSQLLKEQFPENMNEEVEISFSGIASASRRVIRTVDLILNMSELQLGTYEVVNRKLDLVTVLSNLRKEYMNLARSKNLELRFTPKIKNAEIYTDEYALNQIFANLVDNAIKYTKVGFVEIKIEGLLERKYLVQVCDTGIGMSKEYQEEIFEAFSQEERGYTRKFEGSGLGMSLVKNYCELINANISIESERDKGTTFTVVL